MNPVTREQRDEAIAHFKYEGTLVKDCPYGSGHINDTFLLIFEIAEMGRIKVILQRMNSAAFPKPVEVMENITRSNVISEKEDYRKWRRSGT